MQTTLGIVHGLDFLFQYLLLGGMVFSSLVLPRSEQQNDVASSEFKRIRVLLGLSLFTATLWTVISAADMADSWQPGELWNATTQTSFGHYCCLRIIFLLLPFFISSKLWSARAGRWIFLGTLLVMPVFGALSGHAGAQEDQKFLRVGVDYIHLVSVGVWTGGLLALFFWLGPNSGPFDSCYRVVKRFSHFAIASTGGIGITGLLMIYWSGISLRHPLETDYGKLAFAKLFFFGVAMAAASINQFVHLRVAANNQVQFARNVRREVGIEFALVVIIFGIAGFLTRTSLPM